MSLQQTLRAFQCLNFVQLTAPIVVPFLLMPLLVFADINMSQGETEAGVHCLYCQNPIPEASLEVAQEINEFKKNIQQNLCPSIGTDLELLKKAAAFLNCPKSSGSSPTLSCLPTEMQLDFFYIQDQNSRLGFVARDPVKDAKYFVFFGTRSDGPSLSAALANEVFQTAAVEKTIRLVFQDLKEHKPVFLFGHSQGGATAQIVAYFAVKKYLKEFHTLPENNLTLIVFGSHGAMEIMKSLDPEFDPNLFNAIKKYSIVAKGDVVPRINTAIFPSLVVEKEAVSDSLQAGRNPFAKHGIKSYQELTHSDRLCKAEKKFVPPLFRIKSKNNLVYKFARFLQPDPSTVQTILDEGRQEFQHCKQLTEPQRQACVRRVRSYDHEIITRLKTMDHQKTFKFDPLGRVPNE